MPYLVFQNKLGVLICQCNQICANACHSNERDDWRI